MKKRVLALMLSILIIILSVVGCSNQISSSAESSQSGLSGEAEEIAVISGDELSGGEKSETVYAKADANGNIEKIAVSTVLKSSGSGVIIDKSNLSEIKNTEGDEAFESGDGIIRWQSVGEDIHYEGISEDSLPVKLKISYKLDGEDISPESLAGKSGKVTIRFDYENLETRIVSVDDKTYTINVPFAVISAVLLSDDKFSDIEVTNGKAVEMDGQTLAVGLAIPGLSENLNLSEYELTEKIEIPEYVEITANTENFSLDFSATIISSGIFSELDEDLLSDADDLGDGMQELADAVDKLADGSKELFEGAESFGEYLDEYTSGVTTLSDGLSSLNEGIKTINDNKSALSDGAKALSEGLGTINSKLQSISLPSDENLDTSKIADTAAALLEEAQVIKSTIESLDIPIEDIESYITEATAYFQTVSTAAQSAAAALKELDESALTDEQKAILETAKAEILKITAAEVPQCPDLSGIDVKEITEAAKDMKTRIETLAAEFDEFSSSLPSSEEISEILSSLPETFSNLKSGVSELYNGSTQLSAAIDSLFAGIDSLYSGSSQLSSGGNTLASAGSELKTAYDSLTDGISALADGIKAFNDEGISELEKLAGDDLAEIINRIKAIKKADESYDNFSGLSDGMTGSVRFIIETEEISAE